jgi:hypothetical protein
VKQFSCGRGSETAGCPILGLGSFGNFVFFASQTFSRPFDRGGDYHSIIT